MAKNGGYQTKARQMTLEYLVEHKDTAVSVADIMDYLHKKGSNINITTVYRYLDRLVEEQHVFKYMDESADKAIFQYVEQERRCPEHLHLKCILCGKVEHLDCDFMKHINKHICEHHGFMVECSRSILYGYCKTCSQRRKDEKESTSAE